MAIIGVKIGKGAGSVATNTAVGASALAANTTGSSTTVFGYQAGAVSNANDNTLIGTQSGLTLTGASNTAVGSATMGRNAGSTTGVSNAAFGLYSLTYLTSGSYNTAYGQDSLRSNTTASNNTAVGYQAGYSNTTQTDNVFIGYRSGYTKTGGSYNTFVGDQSGVNSTSGGLNTFIGHYAGGSTTGDGNTFVGLDSGYLVTTGSKNTIIGQYNGNEGGLDIRTASNNIVLSDGDGNPRLAYLSSGTTWLFTGNDSTASKYVSAAETIQVLGNTSTGTDYGIIFSNATDASSTSSYACRFYSKTNSQIAGSITFGNTTTNYATSSDYRLKENVAPMTGALEKVLALKPVTYTWKSDKSSGEGFIAHELGEVCPQAVIGEKDAVDDDGNPQYQGIDTSHLIATLVAAIQELKAEFDAYKATHP